MHVPGHVQAVHCRCCRRTHASHATHPALARARASEQGLESLQSVGQDLVIRGNPALTTLEGLTSELQSVGAFRGGDVYIEANPRLASLAGLQAPGIPVYGNVTVTDTPRLPEGEVAALKAKATPVPPSVETLANGLPSNMARPSGGAAGAAAPMPAAAQPGVNATAGAAAAAAAAAQPAGAAAALPNVTG